MTLVLALLALETGAQKHLLVAIVARGDHLEGLGEAVLDGVAHAARYVGRARGAWHCQGARYSIHIINIHHV